MKKTRTLRIAALTLSACLIALSAAGCTSASEGKLEKIRDKGEMVVYMDANFAPFEFQGPNGVQGVDVEIARAIAAELGVKATFVEADFDSILMAIKGGKGDVAISGFTITEERKESVDFSAPYIESVQYLILMEASEIAVMEDLAGRKVGVAKDYTGQFLMEDEMGEEGVLHGKGVELREYNSAMEAALDLNIGRIDAVVMDEYVAKNVVSKNPGMKAVELKYSDGGIASEEYGVAVPKNNEDLLEIINKVITELVRDGKIEGWVVEYGNK